MLSTAPTRSGGGVMRKTATVIAVLIAGWLACVACAQDDAWEQSFDAAMQSSGAEREKRLREALKLAKKGDVRAGETLLEIARFSCARKPAQAEKAAQRALE